MDMNNMKLKWNLKHEETCEMLVAYGINETINMLRAVAIAQGADFDWIEAFDELLENGEGTYLGFHCRRVIIED